jgi:hypothetical protein
MNVNSHGLGLNICQKIAIGLGGLITFSSKKDIGSKFKFTFSASEYLKKEPSDSGNDKIVSCSFFITFSRVRRQWKEQGGGCSF